MMARPCGSHRSSPLLLPPPLLLLLLAHAAGQGVVVVSHANNGNCTFVPDYDFDGGDLNPEPAIQPMPPVRSPGIVGLWLFPNPAMDARECNSLRRQLGQPTPVLSFALVPYTFLLIYASRFSSSPTASGLA